MLYSTITAFLGFKPNEGEYKVMGFQFLMVIQKSLVINSKNYIHLPKMVDLNSIWITLHMITRYSYV